MDKRYTRFMRGLAVAVGIAHIDGGGKAVFTDDGPDVVGLGPACVAGTEMAGKIMAQPGGFEKTLDIARLAVADNIKRKAGGKDAQGILPVSYTHLDVYKRQVPQ